ncbi:MAG: carbohydrate-binding protein [Clostridia bacterium]|nr:carbohydrate-binding protein [Clostridia bacterium]
MKKYQKVLLSLLIITVCAVAFAFGIFAKLAVPTVTVDFSSQSELTGRASGFLYGFAEDDIPTAEIAESIGINSLATKTAGGLQHPIGDVRNVSETFLSAGGEMLMVYTQDMYDTWYYQLDSLPEYNEKVKTTVSEMASSPYADSLVYCIYNEMDNGAWLGNFWEEENRYKFYDAWKETYGIVKEIDPNAKIAGPGHCGYNYDFIKEFLSYCKENDCLPEVVVWHELSDQSIYWMKDNFNGYYSICDELGIERLPVCISEYGLMKTNGIPGESVKWIARLEKQDAYGCVAYWRLANNLSDTVADDVTPNSNYWVYNFYAKMKGKELATEEWDLFNSNIGNWLKGKYPLMNKGFIALASYDEAEEKFYIMTSGSEMNGKIKIENLKDSTFSNGDKVKIEISSVNFRGLGGEVISPTEESVISTTVKNNSITFRTPADNKEQAFFIEITKGEAENRVYFSDVTRIEAENGEVSGTAYVSDECAYSISGGGIVRDINIDSSVSFSYKSKNEGKYVISLIYANGSDDSTEVDVTVNGKIHSVICPSTLKNDCTEVVSLYAECSKGKNDIVISARDDKMISLDLIEISPLKENEVYFEKLMSRNVSSDENAYYSIMPTDGYYKLSGLSDNKQVIINGITLEDDTDSIFYFSRGYNKIVLPDGVTFTEVEAVENTENSIIITPDDVIYNSGAKSEEDNNTSTGKHIGWISSETGGNVEFTVNVPEAGYYSFTVEYANNEKGGYHDYNVDLVERYITVSVNGENTGNHFFRSTYSWDNYKTKTIILSLSAGENKIILSNDGSCSFNNNVTYAPDIGSITISKTA